MIAETFRYRKDYWAEVWAGIAQMEAKLQAHKDFVAFMQEYGRRSVEELDRFLAEEQQDVPTGQSRS